MAEALSINSFLECLSTDFPQLQATKHDLEQLTKPFVVKFYATLLQEITRVRESRNPLWSLTENQLDFIRVSREGPFIQKQVVEMNLFKMVKFIFDRIDSVSHEFRIGNIMYPQLSPKKTYVLMFHFYDFYTSCCEFDEVYGSVRQQDDKASIIANLKEANSSLQRDLEEKEQARAERNDRMAYIKQRLADYTSENEAVENMLKELQAKEELELKKLNQLKEQEMKQQEYFNKVDSEKKQYESLIVSGDGHVLDSLKNVQERKEKSADKLQQLTKLSQSSQTKIAIFDKVLSLNEELHKHLREEVSIGNNQGDLRRLYSMARSIKEDCDSGSNEVLKDKKRIKLKRDAVFDWSETLASLQVEKDALSCQWDQRLQKYKEHQADLEATRGKAVGRKDITAEALNQKRAKIEQIEKQIADQIALLQDTHKSHNETMEELRSQAMDQVEAIKAKVKSLADSTM